MSSEKVSSERASAHTSAGTAGHHTHHHGSDQLHSESEKRSNVETLGLQKEGRGFEEAHGPTYSGQGQIGSSLVIFVILFVVFLLGLYMLGFYPEGIMGGHGVIPWIIALILLIVPWGIVYHLMSSKTNTKTRENGVDLTMR